MVGWVGRWVGGLWISGWVDSGSCVDGEMDDGWVGEWMGVGKDYPDGEQGQGNREEAGLRCCRTLSAMMNMQMYSVMVEGAFLAGSLEGFNRKIKQQRRGSSEVEGRDRRAELREYSV